MKFHLTYEGRLDSNGSAKHKHEIRKAFHTQLKRLSDVEPNLAERNRPEEPSWETVAKSFERLGYRFVPLAIERLSMIAWDRGAIPERWRARIDYPFWRYR